jgi:hypothetical protein
MIGMWHFIASYRYLLLACPVLAVVIYCAYMLALSPEPTADPTSAKAALAETTSEEPTGTLWDK